MLKYFNKLNKHTLIMATIMFFLCIGAFLFPATAYAVDGAESDAEDSELDSEMYIDGDAEYADTTNEYESEEFIIPDEVYGDATENNIFTGDFDFLVEAISGNLTPDGTATIVDNIFLQRSGLEFFTFTTDAGNIFYLVIDRTREDNNVYFLNAVNERSLLALAEVADLPDEDYTVSGLTPPPDDTDTDLEDSDLDDAVNQEADAEGSGAFGNLNGTTVYIIIGAVIFGAVAYYFKIVRPKKRAAEDDGYDESDDYDDGDDYMNPGGQGE